MIPRVAAFLFAVLACDGVQRQTRVVTDSVAGESMVGAWDARLSLTNPYPLGLRHPAARKICGTIGFVENHRGSGADAEVVPSVGVYDLDLSRLGLDWLSDDSFPTAIATEPRETRPGLSGQLLDSVTIVLNPGSSERIVLLGRHDVAGIDGDWTAQSARGTATGSFSLRPHNRPSQDC
jgi:hypothetical protein